MLKDSKVRVMCTLPRAFID